MIIKTQAEWDALPTQFDSHTVIEIQCPKGTRVAIARVPGNSSVVARENSSVEAWGNSSVVAWENSSVVAGGDSSVVARGNSSVEAWGNSSVEAWGNSSVVAGGNSSVEAWENSPHKIAFRACVVLYQCDRMGKEIAVKAVTA